MVWPSCVLVPTMVPQLWVRCTMMSTWRQHGGLNPPWRPYAPLMNSTHHGVAMASPWRQCRYSGLKAPWCPHDTTVVPKRRAQRTMASVWRPRGTSMVDSKNHGVTIVRPWCPRGCTILPLWLVLCTMMSPLRAAMTSPWYRYGGRKALWRLHGVTMALPCHAMVAPWTHDGD